MTDVLPGQTGMFEAPEPEKRKAPRVPTDKSAMVSKGEPVQVIPSSMGKQVSVAAALVPLLVDIKSIKPHPRNLRKHNIDAIMAAIDKYGIMSPVVVQASTRFVCKGNGTMKAAQLLGAEQIPASIVEIDDETAWTYLLDDNKASDLADYDRVELTKALTGLADAGKLDSTLWTLDDLETLQAETGQLKVLEPEFAGDYSLDAATMEERRARVTTNTGSKMRQTSVILSVKQHEAFMANIEELRKVYGTTGVIATVVEAVKRQAELHRGDIERISATVPVDEQTAEELAANI